MLSDYMVHPSLATANIDKARGWYAERLGLEPRSRPGGAGGRAA